MTWTTERPTVPGWYWTRWRGGRVEAVQLHRDAGTGVMLWGDDDACALVPVSGLWCNEAEWAGPIPPPPAG